jgi:hypothetical protein
MCAIWKIYRLCKVNMNLKFVICRFLQGSLYVPLLGNYHLSLIEKLFVGQ